MCVTAHGFSLTLPATADYARVVSRLGVLGLMLLCASLAAAQTPYTRKQAAASFERGQTLYGKGQFAEAVTAFTEAHRLVPDWRALFNIARCYENIGDAGRALDFYRQALGSVTAPADRAYIEQRMQRLSSRPVRVFVSSRPPGATVTVDGRTAPEPGKTPLVTQLTPGEHVLLLRRDGHYLAPRRIVVETDKELPVEIALERLPPRCPPPPRPKPCPSCPPLPRSLVDLRRLHVHLSILGAFGLTSDRPLAGGPGIQVYGTYRRVVFGGHFLGLPMGEERLDTTQPSPTGDVFTQITPYWLVGQFEGGYAFPFSNFYIHTTVGLGVSADRIVFRGEDKNKQEQRMAREAFAFTWSVGGAIEAMATRWLSFGTSVRFGMVHGERVDKDDPTGSFVERNLPYGTLWGSATFHL